MNTGVFRGVFGPLLHLADRQVWAFCRNPRGSRFSWRPVSSTTGRRWMEVSDAPAAGPRGETTKPATTPWSQAWTSTHGGQDAFEMVLRWFSSIRTQLHVNI